MCTIGIIAFITKNFIEPKGMIKVYNLNFITLWKDVTTSELNCDHPTITGVALRKQ